MSKLESRQCARLRTLAGAPECNLAVRFLFLFSDSKAVFSRCDVTDWDDQLKLFDVAEQTFGVVRPTLDEFATGY